LRPQTADYPERYIVMFVTGQTRADHQRLVIQEFNTMAAAREAMGFAEGFSGSIKACLIEDF
jgi:hypothetical protein